jgi:hypothetical protein
VDRLFEKERLPLFLFRLVLEFRSHQWIAVSRMKQKLAKMWDCQMLLLQILMGLTLEEHCFHLALLQMWLEK